MIVKLVSLDVDGTLLATDGSLPDENRAAIRAALARGVRIVLNTGKPPSTVMRLANELGLTDPLITLGGALILKRMGACQWEVKHFTPLRPNILACIAPIVAQLPLSLFVLCLDNSYVYHAITDQKYLDYFAEMMTRNNFWEYTLLEQSPLIDPGMVQFPILKIMFHSDKIKAIDEAYSRLNTIQKKSFTVEYSSPGSIDLRSKLGGKRQAVERLCQEYNIHRSEVMALGDYETDLEVIEWAGLGAVMQNAPSAVRARVGIVAPSNDDAGVAQMLNRYVLQGESDAE